MPALIVDEGPGISGSSMTAVSEWLLKAGFTDISFLPGHANGPGKAASESVRGWWSRTPTYHTGLNEMRWCGASLNDLLANESATWCGPVGRIYDLSAGAWRSQGFKLKAGWPPISKGFEQTKILCLGKRSGLLWKFSGLTTETDFLAQCGQEHSARLQRLVDNGFVLGTVTQCLGFIATPWIEGTRLNSRHANKSAVLMHIARYIACSAAPPLKRKESERAIDRLRTMLLGNVNEALGKRWETRAAKLSSFGAHLHAGLSYGDGRLAPHEWVQTPGGKIIKTDATGHDRDHTMIGRQSVLWDVAGAIVEWDLNVEQTKYFCEAVVKCGITVNRRALEFYKAAYLAFQVGLLSFGFAQAGDNLAEQRRVRRRLEQHKKSLRRILAVSPGTS